MTELIIELIAELIAEALVISCLPKRIIIIKIERRGIGSQ